ncbi:MAG: SRPBCC domain-containing protein [Acidobacteria bacterium]|nr:SRPBCC domain-containing protein [Acidobacteriota bacterium]
MNDFGRVVERLLPGPIERVWEYLTKPDNLAAWLAAGEIELRVGGRVELRFDVQEAPDRRKAGAVIRGVVTRCEPPRALAYSWIDASADRPPGESLTTQASPAGRLLAGRVHAFVSWFRRVGLNS